MQKAENGKLKAKSERQKPNHILLRLSAVSGGAEGK
jgi:hypothetical protein